MGFFFEKTKLCGQHRKMLKRLLSLETDVARQHNDTLRSETGLARYDKLTMAASAVSGLHFGYYCMLRSTEILRESLSADDYDAEKNALLELFIKQHRNICSARDLSIILAKDTAESWKRQLQDVWSPAALAYLDYADNTIKEYYANI